MTLSIVIPAYNEEAYLSETLASIATAIGLAVPQRIEIIVVDNASLGRTADVAAHAGATVISESRRSIARARNTGAAAANGEVLLFIDADTIVPQALLLRILEVMCHPACFGGAVDTKYTPRRKLVGLYLQFWRVLGLRAGMAQGAAQFCRRDAFMAINGYDETLWMGEDVDFYWRLAKFARRNHGTVHFIGELQVRPSSRRFDRWPFWRILLWTNPLFIWLFQRRELMWKGWYERAVR